MAKRELHLCKDCKFCLRLFDYEEQSYSLYCDNCLTKEADPLMGFLSHDQTSCEYFEKPQVTERGAARLRPQKKE